MASLQSNQPGAIARLQAGAPASGLVKREQSTQPAAVANVIVTRRRKRPIRDRLLADMASEKVSFDQSNIINLFFF